MAGGLTTLLPWAMARTTRNQRSRKKNVSGVTSSPGCWRCGWGKVVVVDMDDVLLAYYCSSSKCGPDDAVVMSYFATCGGL